MEFLAGKQKCRKFVNQETNEATPNPSYICYFWVFLILLGTMFAFGEVNKRPVYATLRIVFNLLLTYIMYLNCTTCNPWRGFFMTLAMSVVVETALYYTFVQHDDAKKTDKASDDDDESSPINWISDMFEVDKPYEEDGADDA